MLFDLCVIRVGMVCVDRTDGPTQMRVSEHGVRCSRSRCGVRLATDGLTSRKEGARLSRAPRTDLPGPCTNCHNRRLTSVEVLAGSG